MKLFFAVVSLVLLPLSARADIQVGNWKFLGDVDISAGQFFFKNNSDSVGGYTNVNLQQARSFSSDSGFYLSEQSVFNGFKQLTDLAGGGTLFQQTLTDSVGIKWIKRFEGGYSLKPSLGVTNELFKETNDESLGKGLYDFWRYEAGLTWERKTRLGLSTPWTYQLSYDFYFTHYPRLTSLSSQFGAQLSAPDPGKHLLDAYTNQLSYRSDFDLPGFASAWLLYSLSLVSFTDQKVVNAQGQYLASLRTDAMQTLNVGYSKRLTDMESMGRVRPTVAMGVTLNDNVSNQNDFDTDPSRLQYVGGYYNYYEGHLSPSLGALFLTPLINTRLTYDLSYHQYTGRLTQNSDGSYNSSKLYQMIHTVMLDASYPLLRNLDLQARLIYASATTNTHYEQVFTYNYWSTNYYAGVVWRL